MDSKSSSTCFVRVKLIVLTVVSFSIGAIKLQASESSSPLYSFQGSQYHLTVGEACEQLAEMKVRKEFPASRYNIFRNIIYSQERTLGELDLVVTEKESDIVVLVAEVKCRKKVSRAASLAKKQLKRFEEHIFWQSLKLEGLLIGDVASIEIASEDGEDVFLVEQFTHNPSYRIISHDDPKAEVCGFDILPMSLLVIEEMVRLFNDSSWTEE